MWSPRTKIVSGKKVMEPRLQRCGMVVGDVNLVRETMETKIRHTDADRWPREVMWSNSAGWRIKLTTSSLSQELPLASCSSCGAPVSLGQANRCPWCGKARLCPGCFPHDNHSPTIRT
jgi:hypothetical protein